MKFNGILIWCRLIILYHVSTYHMVWLLFGSKNPGMEPLYDPTQHEKKYCKKSFSSQTKGVLIPRTKQLDFSINVLLPTVKGLMALHSCMYFTRK